MRYAYQGSGHPVVTWKHGIPVQSRAGDTVGLGSLAGPALVLPRPGAPEPINGYLAVNGLGGCSCSGSCGCGTPLSGIVDTITGLSLPMKIAAAIGGYFLYKKMKKR